MPLFYQPDISLGRLSEEESNHAIKVLRLVEGDKFELTDGKGGLIIAHLTQSDPRKCKFEIIRRTIIPRRNFSIHLGVAPTKNMDRMEWMIEKSVELGIEKISFLRCKTSVRASINMERIEKIAISAMKQSQQVWLPSVGTVTPFGSFIMDLTEKQKFIATVGTRIPKHLKDLATPSSDYAILIGPEGDFSRDELEAAQLASFQPVSLGPNRLRTETAGLTAVTILNLINQ